MIPISGKKVARHNINNLDASDPTTQRKTVAVLTDLCMAVMVPLLYML